MNPLFESAVELARAKVLLIEFYCEAGACPAREVRVTVKDLDRNLQAHLEHSPPCPLCGEKLKVHWVEGLREYRDAERLQIVGLVLAEYGIYKLAGEESIAKALDALATKIEHWDKDVV